MSYSPLVVLDETFECIHAVPSVNCASGGRRVEHWPVPVERYRVTGLPDGLDALILTSDLQGVERDDVPVLQRRLVGHRVAEDLEMLCTQGVLPSAQRCGVILAGDLYAIPSLDKRGGLGEVMDVWRSFRQAFAWVAGVGGNHDLFNGECHAAHATTLVGCHGLDGHVVALNDLRIGGVSGVIGNKGKPWRRPSKDFLGSLQRVRSQHPHIAVLHQGPEASAPLSTPGHPDVTAALELHEQPMLVVCGHVHWDKPLGRLANGLITVINVDHRVVVLERADL